MAGAEEVEVMTEGMTEVEVMIEVMTRIETMTGIKSMKSDVRKEKRSIANNLHLDMENLKEGRKSDAASQAQNNLTTEYAKDVDRVKDINNIFYISYK
jgi:hypothetical protein